MCSSVQSRRSTRLTKTLGEDRDQPFSEQTDGGHGTWYGPIRRMLLASRLGLNWRQARPAVGSRADDSSTDAWRYQLGSDQAESPNHRFGAYCGYCSFVASGASTPGGETSRRVYESPPIQEALCEIRFAHPARWGLEVPPAFHQLVRSEYPGEPRQQIQTALEVAAGQGSPTTMSVQQSASRIVFSSKISDRLVTVGDTTVSVHVLHPYEGWPNFRRRIESALDAYVEVTGKRHVQRIGMRYVNRITVEGEVVDLADYFRLQALTPKDLEIAVSDLFLRTAGVVQDAHGTGTNLILASAQEDEASAPTFILDIDVFREYAGDGLAFDQLWPHIDAIRGVERVAFEGIIMDRLRQQFREVKHADRN